MQFPQAMTDSPGLTSRQPPQPLTPLRAMDRTFLVRARRAAKDWITKDIPSRRSILPSHESAPLNILSPSLHPPSVPFEIIA